MPNAKKDVKITFRTDKDTADRLHRMVHDEERSLSFICNRQITISLPLFDLDED